MTRRLAGFALLLLAVAGCASGGTTPRTGAAPAAPPATVLLVSLDGFRWDYVDRAPARTLRALARRGVRAEGLVPAFPSKTFTNHYTLVTGLGPGRSGMLANNFRDPGLGDFSYRDSAAVRDPRWWGGEPIWLTAELQGVRAATMFWAGSEAPIGGRLPGDWKPYQHGMPAPARVDTVLSWLGRPVGSRPRLVTLYLHHVDAAGHEFGPDAAETDSAIALVDAALARLVRGLDSLGLARETNVVVVSDHGMAATARDRVVLLDDLLDLDAVDVVDWSPVAQIWPGPGVDPDTLAARLDADPHLRAWTRATLPSRWGLNHSPRTPPVLALADEGWTITTRARFEGDTSAFRRGSHGYDESVIAMRGVFVAAGPGFRSGVTVPAFRNIHVYAVLAELLGVKPAPNEGSVDSVRAMLR
ncbi:MAG TPA: ectonucleotide pyrophosphatase/phosphodiesterase [Gemmatimonadales bacterium]|nr:ectonucleotide pyrophosphatase/phosphodiesterase [Gemmatimonadales bacterium]